MAKEKAVANTSTVLFIAKIKRFDLLKNIFSEILIPEEVIEEILFKESPENEPIKKEIGRFIQKAKLKEIKDFNLDKGEKAAISLCIEKNIKVFLSDDKKARKFARGLEIMTLGVAGIIKYNLQNKKISKEAAENLISQLIKNDYYMSSSLLNEMNEFISKEPQ